MINQPESDIILIAPKTSPMYQQAQPQGAADGAGQQAADDGTVDAEYTVDDENK